LACRNIYINNKHRLPCPHLFPLDCPRPSHRTPLPTAEPSGVPSPPPSRHCLPCSQRSCPQRSRHCSLCLSRPPSPHRCRPCSQHLNPRAPISPHRCANSSPFASPQCSAHTSTVTASHERTGLETRQLAPLFQEPPIQTPSFSSSSATCTPISSSFVGAVSFVQPLFMVLNTQAHARGA